MSSRVVLCVQNLPVPLDPRVSREARSLRAAGYEVSVICPRAPGMPARECWEGVEVLRYRAPRTRGGVAGQLAETAAAVLCTALLALRIRMRGPIAVLHAANPPDTFFLAALLLRPFGTRFVFDQHDLCPELLDARGSGGPVLRGLLRLLERASYRSADLVVVPNDSYRRIAIARGKVRGEAVVVVRSGPEDVRAAPAHSDDGVPVVAFAGVMGHQDGVETLLDAAAELLGRRPGSFRLDLIGDGDARPGLRAHAERLGISHAVSWPGWLGSDALRRRLAGATVAVSPDPDTPFNRLSTMAKVPDYLASGLAAVVADLPENRVTAGDAAVYYAPGDHRDLAKRIEELLDDEDLRSNLRRRAQARAEVLCWRHAERRLLDAYAWLLRGGPPVGAERLDR